MYYAHEYIIKNNNNNNNNTHECQKCDNMQTLIINFTFVVYWHYVTNK